MTISSSSPSPSNQAIKIALWGPSAAGKTMLLAQLYLRADLWDSEWRIFPTGNTLEWIDRNRKDISMNNRFPPATPVGTADSVVYEFKNIQTQRRATLSIDDRAGKESEVLDEKGIKRLSQADGLVLLFDPTRPDAQFCAEVERTLDQVHVAFGKTASQDNRPIAICLSKTDDLIRNASDLRHARRDPADFVRNQVKPQVIKALDRFCSNYKLFPVSSVGIALQFGSIEPVVFYDEQLYPRVGQASESLNLIEPFAWLFDEVERIGIRPQPEPETQAKPKPETQAKPKPETKPKSETKAKPKSETKAKKKAETQAKPKPETKPETQAEPKPETPADQKPETPADQKPESPSVDPEPAPKTLDWGSTGPEPDTESEEPTVRRNTDLIEHQAPTTSCILHFLGGLHEGSRLQVFTISGLDRVRIGSDPERVDLVFDNRSVSGLHCYFSYDANGTVFVQDDGSTNGTFINALDIRKKGPRVLGYGDRIQWGHVKAQRVKSEKS